MDRQPIFSSTRMGMLRARSVPGLHGKADTLPVGTFFRQPCPTCGRGLLIRVAHLGRKVCCSHCGRVLVARDPSSEPQRAETNLNDLRGRIEQLLATLG